MLPVFVYGHDYGNAETCGFLIDQQGHEHSKMIPSALAQGSLSDIARKRSAGSMELVEPASTLERNEYVIEFNGKEYFAGELALKEARAASTKRGDITRYWSESSLVLLLLTSSVIAYRNDYELYVVTGLPVETFTIENRKKVKAALEGEHRFSVNGIRYRAIVHVLNVIMEGAGAMIGYGLPDQVLQGCIDIGGRTTDLYASTGQKVEAELCQGKARGVESAADLLSTQFFKTHERPLRAPEARMILRAYINKTPYPVLYANGAKVDGAQLELWTENALRETGSDIASFVSVVWNTTERGKIAADFARVLLVGGGAHYFAEDIKRVIHNVYIPPFPEKANARGYALLAATLAPHRSYAGS